MMPIPISAYNIMFTSFAPSPMERIFSSGNFFLTIFTISAFYIDDTWQANTASAFNDTYKNLSFSSLF